jgi:stage II sporulation protein R
MKKYLSKQTAAKYVLIPTAVFLGLVITICITTIASFAENYENITENVLRLHILANSDSEADQSLKLKVRDAVLAATADSIGNAGNAELSGGNSVKAENDDSGTRNPQNENIAIVRAAADLDVIYKAAKDEIRRNGYDYDVDVELLDMPFDNRVYTVNEKDFTMPEGVYTAVRVTIGEAKGKNWWCVMFPPLCLPAVSEDSEAVMSNDFTDSSAEAVMSENFTEDQLDIMSEPQKYEAKLYVVELWNKVFDEKQTQH